MIFGLLALVIMIIIHEWGHFIAGRICKVPVYEFSIGMGPLIWQHKGKKETKWSIRALPIGGYCAFDNLEDKTSLENGITDSAIDNLPIRQRIFICAAGPFMNIFLAFLISFFIAIFAGKITTTTTISGFIEDYPAAKYLEIDDTIMEANGIDVYNNPELLSDVINASNGEKVEILVKREDKFLHYDIESVKDGNEYYIGIYEKSERSGLSFFSSIGEAFKNTGFYIKNVFDGFTGLLTRKYKASEASGVVGAVNIMGQYAKKDTILTFLALVSFISVNLGLVNLVPIPGLDGSKILMALFEAVTKKKPNRKLVNFATGISMAILLGLMIILTFSDIIKMF